MLGGVDGHVVAHERGLAAMRVRPDEGNRLAQLVQESLVLITTGPSPTVRWHRRDRHGADHDGVSW
jgi:hypothetical protein